MFPFTTLPKYKQQMIDGQIHQIMRKFYYLTDVAVAFIDQNDAFTHHFPTAHYHHEPSFHKLYEASWQVLNKIKTVKPCEAQQTFPLLIEDRLQFHLFPIFDEERYMGSFMIGPTYSVNTALDNASPWSFLHNYAVFKPEPKDLYTANLIQMLTENAIIHFGTNRQFVNSLMNRNILSSTHAYLQLISDLVIAEEKHEALTLYRTHVLLHDEAFFLKQRLLTLETMISSRLIPIHNAPDNILTAKNHFFVQIMKAISTNCLSRLGENMIKVYTEFKHSQSLQGKSPAVRKAILYIKEHFKEPIKLVDVAKYVKLSSTYLSSHFSSEMNGITLVDYIRLTRIQYSQRLLRYTNMPICEIAKESGFENQYYYSTVFKSLVGICPKRYRCINAPEE